MNVAGDANIIALAKVGRDAALEKELAKDEIKETKEGEQLELK
jgi:hypothetical protein